MSSGNGQAGSTYEYIRDAQDVTRQLKRRMTYLNFKQGGDGAPRYTTDNGNESYLSFLFGKRESYRITNGASPPYPAVPVACYSCLSGNPFQLRDVRLFR